MEAVFLASGLLCRKRGRGDTGNRPPLWRKPRDQGKTAQSQTARLSHSCLTVQEGEWVGCSTNAIVPGLWIRNTLRRVACDRAPEATWPLWPCFADFDDLIHTVADCRKLGIRQSAHRVGSGLTNTPVKRFGLMAQHVTCLPAFRFFAVPTGMANGLSALYSAVVMGNPMTREVLSLKIRGERTRKG